MGARGESCGSCCRGGCYQKRRFVLGHVVDVVGDVIDDRLTSHLHCYWGSVSRSWGNVSRHWGSASWGDRCLSYLLVVG